MSECARRCSADLSGIEEVEKQRGWLQDMDSKIQVRPPLPNAAMAAPRSSRAGHSCGGRVRQGKAYEVLRDAVLKRQQADIGSALQVRTLHCLPPPTAAVARAVFRGGPGRTGRPAPRRRLLSARPHCACVCGWGRLLVRPGWAALAGRPAGCAAGVSIGAGC